jgi:hypothetical protein
MGFQFFYSEPRGDIRDPENSTGRREPWTVEVGERDKYVTLRIHHEGEGIDEIRQVAIEPDRIGDLIRALQEAVSAARR